MTSMRRGSKGIQKGKSERSKKNENQNYVCMVLTEKVFETVSVVEISYQKSIEEKRGEGQKTCYQ